MSSYHGWTHAPKEQGGTDPVPFPPGGAAPFAVIYNGVAQKAYGIGGTDAVPFNSTITKNDTAPIFTFTGGSQAKQVQIAGAGLYEVNVEVAWEDWGASLTAANVVKLRLGGVFGAGYGDNLYNRQTTTVDDTDVGLMRMCTTFVRTNATLVTMTAIAEQDSGSDQWLDGIFLKVVQLAPIT